MIRRAAEPRTRRRAETAGDAAQRIARLRRLAEEEPDVPPSVFGTLAVAVVNANEPADVVAGLALRALDGAPKLLPEAVDALAFAERYEEVLSRFSEALADTADSARCRTCSGFVPVPGSGVTRIFCHLARRRSLCPAAAAFAQLGRVGACLQGADPRDWAGDGTAAGT